MRDIEEYSTRLLELKESLSKVDFSQLSITKEDLKDPYCDPENPKIIDFEHISAAAFKLKGGIENTPCTVSYNFIIIK